MKKFQFRLQAALELRERKEEQLRGELGQIQERYRLESLQLEQLFEMRENQMQSASSLRIGGPLTIEQFRARERYLERLEEEIVNQHSLLELVQGEMERKLAEVVVASQEKQALEKLRERHAEDHRREEMRQEQNFLDEIASIRASRVPA